MHYPESRRGDVVETLHGEVVPDPYRWLEDPDAPETVAWVAAQNEVTESYLAALPDREWFASTMRSVIRRPRAGVPMARGGRYVVTRNDGTQNQDVWFVADSLAELRAGGRVLVDPNSLSSDGTRSLTSFSVSSDGARAAYGISGAGSDWATFHLLDLATGAPIDDAPVTTKFSHAAWLPDGRSYAYTSFPPTHGAEGTETVALARPSLRLHRIGDPPDADEEVLAFPEDDSLMMFAEVTDDDRFLAVTIVAGTENRNRLWLFPIETGPDGRSRLGSVVKVADEPVAEFTVVASDGRRLVVQTDLDAERGRLVAVDLERLAADGTADWVEVVPERTSTLLTVTAVREGFVAAYLVDASPEIRRFDRSGRDLGVVTARGGSLVGLNGRPESTECFVGLSSVTAPTSSYRIDTATGEAVALPDLVPAAEGGFVAPPVSVERRAATSADGTRVPYFLLTPDRVDPSVPQPTLLWGYGGFKIPILADYRSGWSGWLAAGGRLALANLRGGGEFGTSWHEDGRLDRKQNVFDDFIAVAEDLTATGVTTPSQLALHGRSNGGLLVGAVLTQRPDLAAVALPAVGVLDMLRFHRFTIGAAWISDYGDPDDPDQFAVLRAYSPLHNVVPDRAYPATLVLTGDHDDRVVPLHSHKFTAALQHAQASAAPVLTRVETAAGHGMGRPTWLEAAEWADLLTFAAHHTGLRPPAAVGGAE
ncbi:MAG TPA: prolyl oligopeptidase family serine peptidase [Propionibacteriaceae bacterium]|nr:prolyl oligopeptidase family serine peptidase [Propionibacteriaceae bacterium]